MNSDSKGPISYHQVAVRDACTSEVALQTSQHSRFHRVSYGFTAFLKVSRWLLHFNGFTNFEQIFSQMHSFLKKQTKVAHSIAAEACISSMINKNKTSSHSSLSLSWALLFIALVQKHTNNPFQCKPPSDLLKNVKKSTAEYNRQHSCR